WAAGEGQALRVRVQVPVLFLQHLAALDFGLPQPPAGHVHLGRVHAVAPEIEGTYRPGTSRVGTFKQPLDPPRRHRNVVVDVRDVLGVELRGERLAQLLWPRLAGKA